MSFDLGVFYTERPQSDDDAGERYVALCDGSNLADWIEPSPKVEAFLNDLTTRYPQIDDVADEAVDDSPWSCAFDVSEGHAIMPMVWSRAEEMAAIIAELAAKHGLVCFDPQEGKIVSAPPGIHVEETEATAEEDQRFQTKPEAIFTALLDELLKPRGFARRRHRWQKDAEHAVITFEISAVSGIVEFWFFAWFKALGEVEPREVKLDGLAHIAEQVGGEFLPEPLTFRMLRATHLDGDYAESVPQLYGTDDEGQEIASYFEPRAPLTLEWRLATMREAMEQHVLPLFDRIERGEHEAIFAERQAEEDAEHEQALEQARAVLDSAVAKCRKLRADGVDGRDLMDALLDEVEMVSDVALVLCLSLGWPISESKDYMEAHGLRWSSMTQSFIDGLVEDVPYLKRHDDGRIEMLSA